MKSGFRALTSHTNERQHFVVVVASSGTTVARRWQVLGGSAEWAGLLDFVRSCQNLTDFDITISSRPAPLRGRRINRSAHSAEPTPKACGLVSWFFGVLVVGVCITIRGLAVDGRSDCLEVLLGS